MTLYTVTEIEKGKVRPWSRAYRTPGLARRAVAGTEARVWKYSTKHEAMALTIGQTTYILKRVML
jgi:hypothetical protein